jgi:hypothetical protein
MCHTKCKILPATIGANRSVTKLLKKNLEAILGKRGCAVA